MEQKVEKIVMKAEKVNDRVVGVEKKVATGMKKAKEEVKNDVKSEMALRCMGWRRRRRMIQSSGRRKI